VVGPQTTDQLDLWDSTVTLGERFSEEIVRRPVPIDTRALRALARAAGAIDLYVWLTYRMSYLGDGSSSRPKGRPCSSVAALTGHLGRRPSPSARPRGPGAETGAPPVVRAGLQAHKLPRHRRRVFRRTFATGQRRFSCVYGMDV
jgi:Plasmid encoded RepA protein